MRRVPRKPLIDDERLIRALQQAALMDMNKALAQAFKRHYRIIDRARVVDLGCGLGGLSLHMAAHNPKWAIDAVDASKPMLEAAKKNAAAAKLDRRIRFYWSQLPAKPLKAHGYQVVLSSGLLHHLHNPQDLWTEIKRLASPGAQVMVADYLRPGDARNVKKAVVERYKDAPGPVKHDLDASLRAAYVPRELDEQLGRAQMGFLQYEVLDNHMLILWGEMPRGMDPRNVAALQAQKPVRAGR